MRRYKVKINKPKTEGLLTVKDVPLGGVINDPGNSVNYITGGWRTQRPIWNAEKCTSCLLCWINCPDGSIIVNDTKVKGIDKAHCKGCGICAVECPIEGALTMAQGGSYEDEGGNK
jgi:pyruvate ferredoxin oxidoreductase delta subunit